MTGGARNYQGGRQCGNNVVEPVYLDAKFADIRVVGAVFELVSRNCQLHPRERQQREP